MARSEATLINSVSPAWMMPARIRIADLAARSAATKMSIDARISIAVIAFTRTGLRLALRAMGGPGRGTRLAPQHLARIVSDDFRVRGSRADIFLRFLKFSFQFNMRLLRSPRIQRFLCGVPRPESEGATRRTRSIFRNGRLLRPEPR